ncbi:concanavalin A-like lectin/glucanase domain-containing protein [Aspergillus karnatakaensis]|uniref:glycoside hydrolase family 16 protein n=1 Tax=Aspergillus karnatakaensis TaxID=1810916 RepID=UPI003CCD5096
MYLKHTAALASVLSLAAAQTWTDCNPLEKTCKPNPGLNSKIFTSDFTQGDSALDGWINVNGALNFGPDGAEFTVAKRGDSPTIETDFFFFFGKAEVVFRAAPGVGIVSSIVLESDVLDEVDWETLGGDNAQIQTNYFGKGDTSSYDRGTFEAVGDPQGTFHTYTIDWSPEAISWIIDGAVVRTLPYAEAQGGSRFPQTPMRLRLGIWAGGDPDNAPGTIEWAGGETDFNAAPFTMYVKSVHIENTYPGSQYTYSDNSGSWESIQIDDSKPQPPPSSSTTKSTTTTSTRTTTSSTSSETETETETETSTTETEAETETSTETSTATSTNSPSSEPASPTATETESESSGPEETQSPTPTSDESNEEPEDPEFTGAASSLTGSATGLLTVLGMLTAMLQL